jgi:hypothetical protein
VAPSLVYSIAETGPWLIPIRSATSTCVSPIRLGGRLEIVADFGGRRLAFSEPGGTTAA